MSRTISFAPRAMEEAAADLELEAANLDDVASDLDAVLRAYSSSGSEFVVTLPPHAALIEAQGDQLRGVATSVLHLAAAAEECDRQGVDFRALLAGAASIEGRRSAITRLLNASVHATRDVRAATTQLRLVNRYGSRPVPEIAAIRREIQGGRAMSRRAIRRHQMARYRELKVQRAELQRTRVAARTGIRSGTPVTLLGQRVDHFLNNTRAGSGLRYGGKALGAAGATLGAVDTVRAIRAGDAERAVVSGLSTAGGVLMLAGGPVTMGVGAAITVGVLVYENWDTITSWGSSAVTAVSDLGSSVVDGAKNLFGGIF